MKLYHAEKFFIKHVTLILHVFLLLEKESRVPREVATGTWKASSSGRVLPTTDQRTQVGTSRGGVGEKPGVEGAARGEERGEVPGSAWG